MVDLDVEDGPGDVDEGIRSRENSDVRHEHHNVPLRKDSPAAPHIHQLLRHATLQ